MRVSTNQNEFPTQKPRQSKKLGQNNKSGSAEQHQPSSNQHYKHLSQPTTKQSIGSGSANNSFLQEFVQKQSKQAPRQIVPNNGGNNLSSMLYSSQFEEEKGNEDHNENSFRLQLENNELSRIEE